MGNEHFKDFDRICENLLEKICPQLGGIDLLFFLINGVHLQVFNNMNSVILNANIKSCTQKTLTVMRCEDISIVTKSIQNTTLFLRLFLSRNPISF